MRAWLAAGAAMAAWGALTAPGSAETLKMKAALSGKAEVPANTSPGTGSVEVTYDTATKVLTWTGSYSGLTGPATMAHFHGPAEEGKNAPVMVPSPKDSPISGSATLTDAQATEIMAGRTYFNIHTAANPGGEVRGQVTKQGPR